MALTEIFILSLAYLFGSISSAIVICRVMGKDDPRTVGSKNPGATNVYRIAGKKAATLTLIGDLLKGVIPVWISQKMGMDGIGQSLVALAALLGHCYPIFFKFKGGKGVATAFGALLAVHWVIGVSLLAIWFAVFSVSKTSSISAIIASLSVPLSSFYVMPEAIIPLNIITLIVIWRHHENILKLLSGNESDFK